MKRSTILAMLVFAAFPAFLSAQYTVIKTNPNETSKEQRAAAVMKTEPMRPSIVLSYNESSSMLNTTSKEQMKMPAVGNTAASTSRAIKRNSQPTVRRMNLSAKEKMKLGL